MPRIWGDDALDGMEAGRTHNTPNVVPYEFFSISLQQVDASGRTIQWRMMNALGSNTNRDVMTLMVKNMNLLKEKVRFASFAGITCYGYS